MKSIEKFTPAVNSPPNEVAHVGTKGGRPSMPSALSGKRGGLALLGCISLYVAVVPLTVKEIVSHFMVMVLFELLKLLAHQRF